MIWLLIILAIPLVGLAVVAVWERKLRTRTIRFVVAERRKRYEALRDRYGR